MGNTVDTEPPRFLAFVGTIVMILEGLLFIIHEKGVWDVITGIICLVGGVILLLILGIGLKVILPIPYEWWILLAIGCGVITMVLINQEISTGGISNESRYLGGLLVGIAGLVELGAPEKMKMDHAAKFVLFIGAIIILVLGIWEGSLFIMVIAIAIGIVTLLIAFNVIAFEWWLVLILGAPAFMLVHTNGGAVILVGWIMMMVNEGISIN